MSRVLFVCLQNAGRSQMSRAFFERFVADGRHQSLSAGTTPADALHPEVAATMSELGFDLSGQRPAELTRELAEWADVVVTMGCGDACPFIPGKSYVEWQLDDPAGLGPDQVRRIRDEAAGLVRSLIADLDVRA